MGPGWVAAVCCGCAGLPAWPAEGEPTMPWVREAIEWRLRRGLDDCGEAAPAVDAWTLAWLARAPDVHVDISTAEWPFLAVEPTLLPVLAQTLTLHALDGRDVRNLSAEDRRDAVRCVTRVARRTSGLMTPELREAFRASR